MNASLIGIFLLLRFLTVIYSQTLVSEDPNPFVVYYPATSATITFLLVNSPTAPPGQLVCAFATPPDPGYASAAFGAGTAAAINITSVRYSISLTSLVAGRTSDFSCGFATAPQIARLTKSLSVRLPVKALICGSAASGASISVAKSADTNLPVNIAIRFTDPVPAGATVTCTSTRAPGTTNSPALSVGTTSVTAVLVYQTFPSPDTVNCVFSAAGSSNTASVLINFLDRAIAFSPASIIANSPVIQLSLVSNYNPPADIRLNCTISRNATPTCPAAPDASINWTLSSSQPTFQAGGGQVVQLAMIRIGMIPNITESYRVICCGVAPTPSYIANVTITNQATEYPVIATGAETLYNDTQYFPLSSCPCDLTVGVCDPSCCCDPFCNCTGNVVAIPGPYGGYFSDSLPRSCKYQDTLTKSTFHSILCVEYESSNILGDYIPMQPIIKDLNTFTNVLTSSIRSNNFQIRLTDPSTIPQLASALIPITSNPLTSTVATPYLYLPRQSLNSPNCNLQNPIVFLQEFDSTCTYTVTAANCATFDDPRLSSLFYLLSSSVAQSNCINNAMISSVQGNIPVSTFYRCINAGVVTSCSNDGYTLPPSPSIAGSVCQNVVGAVTYRIFYNASVIVSIGATVDLINVSLGTSLNQRFVVSFASTNMTREAASVQSFTSLQASAAINAPTISGLFGYDDGKPILTVSNTSVPVFVPMRGLPTSASRLCNNVPGNNVLFRQNTFAQCNYDISSLTNCNDKRNRIKDYLDSLFPNAFVAIYGNPTSPADYVTVNTVTPLLVNVSNITMIVVPNITQVQIPLESMQSYCGNIATGIVVTVYYSRQGRAQNQYINNIVGVAKRYQVSSLTNITPYGGTSSSSNLVTLTSYVEFQQLSAGISGDQNTDNNVQGVCLFDVCINELFYPWMFNYEGRRGFYEEAFGLFILGLAIFLLATTYPWW